jgi:hypothetical protein
MQRPFLALFTLWLSMMQGVRVHCLALGGVDLTSPAGRMTMGVIISVAQCLPIAYSHANLRQPRSPYPVETMEYQAAMPSEIARISAEALMVALDCVCTPTFLLCADGHIVHANIAGNELLRSNPTLRKVHTRLVGRRSNEAKILAAVVARVVEGKRSELLRLLSRNGSVSLLMTVTPVPGGRLVTACIADLQAKRPHLASWIQQAFDLSRQNAELAESLMFGVSLAEFARSKNVTLGAARTRLKKLFAQAGKRSQAALVSELLRAAIIAPHGPQ